MKELVERINSLAEQFAQESAKNLGGNKAAGARARKATLELEKLMKEYRKKSVEESR